MSKIIGLTGGIGSGKTTIAKLFIKHGIPVYFADEQAKVIMNRTAVVKKVNTLFNGSVLKEDGLLDRKKIKELVFVNHELLSKLNAIVHPLVKQDFDKWLDEHKHFKIVIKEVAILFETNGHLACDAVILVTAPLEERIERVMKRDNVVRKVVLNIISQQIDDSKAIKLANFVVKNFNNSKNIDKAIETIVKNLQK